MTACRAYQIENRWSAHAANDNAPTSAWAKLKLRLAAQWRFDLPDQIPDRVYDGNLKRVKSFVSDGKGYQTFYNIFDSSGKLVHIFNVTKNEKTEYVTGPTGTIARVTNGTPTYMHPDHLGSAQAGTDHTGAVKWREQYTPFGEQIQNPAANDFVAGCGPKSANFLFGEQKIREKGPAGLDGFTGHIKDKATGLNPCIFCSKNCTVQARYYDPVIGRFLSIDPMDFMGSGGNPAYFNRYSYTANDPINLIDPDGQQFSDYQDDPDHPTPPPIPYNVDGLVSPQTSVSESQLFQDVDFSEQGSGDRMNAVKNLGSVRDASDARDAGRAAGEDLLANNRSDFPPSTSRDFLNNGPGDAMRHGVASAELTKSAGVDVAKAFGDAHERSGSNSAGSRAQDLINNHNGRTLMQNNPTMNVNNMIKFAVQNGFMQNEKPAVGP